MDHFDNKFAGLNGFVWFTGVVEDIDDPLKLGRLRVRIIGYHTENKTDIPIAALQWAYPLVPIIYASISGIGHTPFGPLKGTHVMGFFRDGMYCQEPVILGTVGGEIEEEPNYGEGFSDPDKVYPRYNKTTARGSYPVKTDINPLALSALYEYSPMSWRSETRIENIQQAWPFTTYAEPAIAWAPVYPKNHVKETESGHVEEFDDTPGAERIHLMHRSGSYRELRPDGSRVVRILGDDYEIVLKDKNLAVQGNLNITVQGNVTLITNGNVEQRVKGDMNTAVDGDYNLTVKGSINVKADDEINILTESDLNAQADGDMNLGTEGTFLSEAGDKHYSQGTEVHHNSSSAPTMPEVEDAIENRRTSIPSKLLDSSDPDTVKSKANTGNTQDRVTFQTGNKY